MTRRKLSEYRSKVIALEALGQSYHGWSISLRNDDDMSLADKVNDHPHFVVKVDQGVKGRYKKGLVALDVKASEIQMKLHKFHDLGFEYCLVEPQITHTAADERYIALSRHREGIQIDFSRQGGVHVEAHADAIQSYVLMDDDDLPEVAVGAGFTITQLRKLVDSFNQGFMSLMEINPYIIEDGAIVPLDVAIEVDDAGGYFTRLWSESDFRYAPSTTSSSEEFAVRKLDEKSPSSLKLEMINPNGSIFLLLSGGGASVVVADEVYNLGFGDQLANYGEYSGNPNVEETYLYTLSLLKLLVASKSPKKVLFIGGAVANFTDIANTFEGIIKAIDELSHVLSQQEIKIYVRRGGPRQEIGLARIEKSLKEHGLLGAVYGPTTSITSVVAEAVKEIAQ